MRMFRLSVIYKCSCCLEQSYLFDLFDVVTQWVFIRKDRERMRTCRYTIDIYTGWKNVCVVDVQPFSPCAPARPRLPVYMRNLTECKCSGRVGETSVCSYDLEQSYLFDMVDMVPHTINI